MEEEHIKVFVADNIRLMVTEINELGLKKDNIITIIEKEGQYILIYQA